MRGSDGEGDAHRRGDGRIATGSCADQLRVLLRQGQQGFPAIWMTAASSKKASLQQMMNAVATGADEDSDDEKPDEQITPEACEAMKEEPNANARAMVKALSSPPVKNEPSNGAP